MRMNKQGTNSIVLGKKKLSFIRQFITLKKTLSPMLAEKNTLLFEHRLTDTMYLITESRLERSLIRNAKLPI